MHGPAEHRINGEQFDLEMHIVNVLCDGPDYLNFHENLAVVSIIFKISDHSHPFVEKLKVEEFGHIEEIHFNELFNIAEDKAQEKNAIPFIHYKGSLTNPPCSDIVNWCIFKEVLPIKEEHV
jgi:carbonic anhydrase